MKSSKSMFLLLLCICLTSNAQKSKLWEEFVVSKSNGEEPTLPDFSYAGYKYSEEGLPKSEYQVFNVVDYGANPSDNSSDKNAIKKAVKAAENNGEGVIYFPTGKYYINTPEDDKSIIEITSSKIVFRGEDQNNTILFFEGDLPPKNPDQLWTCPAAIATKVDKKNKDLAKIIEDSRRETFVITVDDPSQFVLDDWVIIEVKNTSKDLLTYDLMSLKPESAWTSILEEGVVVKEHHKIKEITGNAITFYEPIHYDIKAKHHWTVKSFNHLNHIGFENLTFEGNWLKEFVHHRSAQDDGGWTILEISKCVNSWINNCTFKNVSRCASFSNAAYSTALNINVEGNYGHTAVHSSRSSGILIANCRDNAGMHHSFGVDGHASGTVLWRCQYANHTSFEAHASQPRNTLLDNVEGGFFQGRAGGARKNLPNHGRNLVLWNYKETDEAETDFRFVATDSWYWRIVPPIIVGFHGAGTTFNEDEVYKMESLGKPVEPESLFEAQLELRLGKLPNWIKEKKARL